MIYVPWSGIFLFFDNFLPVINDFGNLFVFKLYEMFMFIFWWCPDDEGLLILNGGYFYIFWLLFYYFIDFVLLKFFYVFYLLWFVCLD